MSESGKTPASSAAERLVIFDFDGTLAATLEEALEVVNELAPRYGFEPVDRDLAVTLRGLEIREVLARIGLAARKVPPLLLDLRRAMRHRLPRIGPVAGVPEALEALAAGGATLGIVTSNAEENVRDFLRRSELSDRFSFVVGSTSLFGKARKLRRILAERPTLARRHVVYVGDEARDIEAAHKAGIRAAAVLWGAHNRPLLARHAPDWILERPDELPRILEADGPPRREPHAG